MVLAALGYSVCREWLAEHLERQRAATVDSYKLYDNQLWLCALKPFIHLLALLRSERIPKEVVRKRQQLQLMVIRLSS